MKKALISILLCMSIASSITGCGNETSSAASVEIEETQENSIAAFTDSSSGLSLKNWTGTYKTLNESDTNSVQVTTFQTVSGNLGYAYVTAVCYDIPENADTSSGVSDYASTITLPHVFFAPDQTLSKEEMKTLINQELGVTKSYTLTEFTTSAGDTMFQMDDVEDVCEYSENVSKSTKKAFEALQNEWETQRVLFDYSPYVPASNVEFTTTDTEGNNVDQSIFENADYTLVYLWETDSEPCTDGLSVMQELSEKLDDTQVVTIVGNVYESSVEDSISSVKEILEESSLTIPVYLTTVKINEIFGADSIPALYIVDNEGSIVGTPYVGVPTEDPYEKYDAWIQAQVSNIDEN